MIFILIKVKRGRGVMSLNIKQNVICKVNVLCICLCEEIGGYPPSPSFFFLVVLWKG